MLTWSIGQRMQASLNWRCELLSWLTSHAEGTVAEGVIPGKGPVRHALPAVWAASAPAAGTLLFDAARPPRESRLRRSRDQWKGYGKWPCRLGTVIGRIAVPHGRCFRGS